jgi:transcriptional regulator with XRE-family HTH domain
MSQRATTRTEIRMSPEEKTFFQKLGECIAALRNERGLTQVQLAEALGYSQQQVLSFEKGRRRVPASALPELSKALGVAVEELLGTGESQPAKRGPTPKLQRQIEQLSQLPRSQQRFVSQMLDTVLQQGER